MEYEYCLNPDKDKLPNENDKIYIEYSELLMEATEAGLGYRVEWEDILYLAPTPLVKIDELNRFHSDRGAAIKWEGDEYFYLHGVNFPKEMWEKVTSGKMPFDKIMAIEDIDQRTQAMRFGDVDKFLEHSKAKKLDERMKFRPDGTEVKYGLYEIPPGDIFTETAYYMVYDCPSTAKKYMSGVIKNSTVAEAMSWKISDDEHTVSPEEWTRLQPLITES